MRTFLAVFPETDRRSHQVELRIRQASIDDASRRADPLG